MDHPDLVLVKAALEGSEGAWHELVHRAGPVIRSALRTRIHDDEAERDVHVAILAELHGGALARYEGRSSFTTWVYVLARSRAVDHMRKQRGRRWSPPGFERLGPMAQRVFRLYFVEGAELSIVVDRLRAEGTTIDAQGVVEILDTIESALDARVLRRIGYELHAESVGAASGRLLEYLDDRREELLARSRDLSPELEYLRGEALALHEALRRHVAQLDPAEQRVLTLRFDEGLKAREIAEVMGLASTRRAFTLLDRALRELKRRLLHGGALAAPPTEERPS